jgi:hypothetical protein
MYYLMRTESVVSLECLNTVLHRAWTTMVTMHFSREKVAIALAGDGQEPIIRANQEKSHEGHSHVARLIK